MDNTELAIIVAALLGLSEALALIKGVKANSIFQVIWNILKALSKKKQ